MRFPAPQFRLHGLIAGFLLTLFWITGAHAQPPAELTAAGLQSLWGRLQCVHSTSDAQLDHVKSDIGDHLLETRNPYVWAGLAGYRLRSLELGNNHIGELATIEAAENAARLGPGIWEAQWILAMARIHERRYPEAQVLVARIEKLSADPTAIALARVALALAMHDPGRAENALRAASAVTPQGPGRSPYFSIPLLNLRLGTVLRLQRRYADASVAFRDAVRTAATNSSCSQFARFSLAETRLLFQGDAAALENDTTNWAESHDGGIQTLLALAPYVKFANGGVLGYSPYAPDEAALELAKYPVGARDVPSLLKAGLLRNVDALDGKGNTLLALAAMANLPDVAGSLIKAGANVDHANQDGERALGYFCAAGSDDGVRMLLDARAQARYADRAGNSPLYAAIGSGNAAVVKMILPKVQPIDRKTLDLLLIKSAYSGLTEVAIELVRQGAAINPAQPKLMPPLIAAILSRNRELVAWLLAHGADSRASYLGRSSTDFARDSDDPEILRLVIGAKVRNT